MSHYIDNLTWRYATKKYDATKKVSQDKIDELLEGIRLSASSYGLQPYTVLNIESEDIRQKLQPASWGQGAIVDASHLFVFASKTAFDAAYIDSYIENIAETRALEVSAISGYGDFMKQKVLNEKSLEEQRNWAAKQAYIALGNALSHAAELKLDTTPIEGFEPAQYDEILGLAEKGLTAAVVLAVGYRSEEDQTAHYAKVRKPVEELLVAV